MYKALIITQSAESNIPIPMRPQAETQTRSLREMTFSKSLSLAALDILRPPLVFDMRVSIVVFDCQLRVYTVF